MGARTEAELRLDAALERMKRSFLSEPSHGGQSQGAVDIPTSAQAPEGERRDDGFETMIRDAMNTIINFFRRG